MLKRKTSFYTCFIVLSACSLIISGYSFFENSPPAVKITAPKNKSFVAPNATVRYSVNVSDKEDGESRYEEIAPNEVVMKVKYFSDSSKSAAYLNEKNQDDITGLAEIASSNCFNCHAIKRKLIGPSFQDISSRYPHTPVAAQLLVRRIKEGASGVWGPEVMPSHPELSDKQMQAMVNWIMENTNQPDLNYYVGIEGAFPAKSPGASQPGGVFVLTAIYTDHGSEENHEQRLTGKDNVVIYTKE